LDCDNPLIVKQDYIVDKEVKRFETSLVSCIIIYEGDYRVVNDGKTIKCQQLVYQGYTLVRIVDVWDNNEGEFTEVESNHSIVLW